MIGSFFDWLRHRARGRLWNADQALGRRGEDLAHRLLRKNGYVVVARNYRLAAGDAEADVIAWDGQTLAFVEVKSRRNEDFGPPERAIDSRKRTHLTRVAREYTRKSGTPWEKIRFDLVTVVFSGEPRLELYKDAWQP